MLCCADFRPNWRRGNLLRGGARKEAGHCLLLALVCARVARILKSLTASKRCCCCCCTVDKINVWHDHLSGGWACDGRKNSKRFISFIYK